jgi:radical SAM enzyme (TIGR01210 family)
MSAEFNQALNLVGTTLKDIRRLVPARGFNPSKVAEIEINEFYFDGRTVPRVMVVLRSTGCEHYGSNYGCSMCAHFDGTTETPVKASNYLEQWESVLDGSAIEDQGSKIFDINNYPILCLYNLGSLLNPKEVPPEAVREIFYTLNGLPGIKKTIIESRAEYVTRESLENIRDVYPGLVEVGVGLESTNYDIRELCHHKNMPDLTVFTQAVDLLHEYGFRALAYVNQKPAFLTEKEAIDDAVTTSLYAFEKNVDAVSIEPTSIQRHSLIDFLYQRGLYRVPWLWSVREVVRGIYEQIGLTKFVDLRLGGYFDETVLSGSQGTAPGVERNEIFPYTTSGNCPKCNPRMIEAIKEFNRTYDPNVLYSQPECKYCYSDWLKDIRVVDKRSIPQRIIDTLGS